MPHNSKLHPGLIKFFTSEDGSLYLDTTAKGYIDDGIFLHLELNNWSVSKYKLYLKIWKEAKKRIKDMGYEYAYATAPPGMPEKLIRMFDLEYTGVHIQGFKIMRTKLCQY